MNIKINSDLTDLANGLAAAGGSLRPALAAGAAAVKRTVEDFYRSRPSRSGFFKKCVEGGKVAVTSLTDTSAKVTVDSYELAHHIRGGVIRPIPPRTALAIPVTDEARAAGYPSNNRIPGLFRPKGTRVLAVKMEGSEAFRVLYVLAASVNQRPHPEAIVPAAALEAAASNAMRAAIIRALRGR